MKSLNLPFLVAEVVITTVALLGNILVLSSFVLDRRVRTLRNYHLVSLSVADLLVAAVGIPLYLWSLLTGKPRQFHACLLVNTWILMLCAVSILCLIGITVDRFLSIVTPVWYRDGMNRTRVAAMIGMAWVLGCGIGLLPLMGWNNKKTDIGDCVFIEVVDLRYLVFLHFVIVLAPLLLLFAMYLKIFSEIKKRLRVLDSAGRTIPDVTFSATNKQCGDRLYTPESDVDRRQILTYEDGSRTGRIKIHNRKVQIMSGWRKNSGGGASVPSRREVYAAKTIGAIVIVFAVSWLPLYTINSVMYMCSSCQIPEVVIFIAIWLTHFNSAVNPFLYAIGMREIRASLLTLLRLLCPGVRCWQTRDEAQAGLEGRTASMGNESSAFTTGRGAFPQESLLRSLKRECQLLPRVPQEHDSIGARGSSTSDLATASNQDTHELPVALQNSSTTNVVTTCTTSSSSSDHQEDSQKPYTCTSHNRNLPSFIISSQSPLLRHEPEEAEEEDFSDCSTLNNPPACQYKDVLPDHLINGVTSEHLISTFHSDGEDSQVVDDIGDSSSLTDTGVNALCYTVTVV